MAIKEIDTLKELSFNKQLAFAYLTCERLYPNYVFFSKKYKFGDPAKLKRGIEYLYINLFNYRPEKSNAEYYISVIDKLIPEPANYGTVLVSSALDAGVTAIESLRFLIDKRVSRMNDISQSAYDTVFMYIQELENLVYTPPDKLTFFQKIDNHSLMKKEMLIQTGIISYLSSINNIEPSDIETLLQVQGNKGSLELS